jgi:hypothetical protein
MFCFFGAQTRFSDDQLMYASGQTVFWVQILFTDDMSRVSDLGSLQLVAVPGFTQLR